MWQFLVLLMNILVIMAKPNNLDVVVQPSPHLVNVFFYGDPSKVELEWSDQRKATVDMRTIHEEYCIYKGTIKEDPESSLLITGCQDELKNIQIRSKEYGDALGMNYEC